MRKLALILIVPAALALAGVAWSSQSTTAPVMVHRHASSTVDVPEGLAPELARARLATAKYATSLRRAQRDGYRTIVTQHIPDMGWHFLNPKVTGFDVTKPPILVYVKSPNSGDHVDRDDDDNQDGSESRSRWQLVAFEWVFTETPATPPLPGATYGSFPAACHYVDGTLVPKSSQADCPPRSPAAGFQPADPSVQLRANAGEGAGRRGALARLELSTAGYAFSSSSSRGGLPNYEQGQPRFFADSVEIVFSYI